MTEKCKSTSPSAVEVKICEFRRNKLTYWQSVMLDLLIVAYPQFVTKVKVQQSLYWPIADQRGFQVVEAPRFPDIWHMKLVRVSALCTLRVYPPGNIPGTRFCRDWSEPRAVVQPARLCLWKILMTSFGIEPVTGL